MPLLAAPYNQRPLFELAQLNSTEEDPIVGTMIRIFSKSKQDYFNQNAAALGPDKVKQCAWLALASLANLQRPSSRRTPLPPVKGLEEGSFSIYYREIELAIDKAYKEIMADLLKKQPLDYPLVSNALNGFVPRALSYIT